MRAIDNVGSLFFSYLCDRFIASERSINKNANNTTYNTMKRILCLVVTLLSLGSVSEVFAQYIISAQDSLVRNHWNSPGAKHFFAKPLYGNIESVKAEIFIIENQERVPFCTEYYYFNEFGHVYKIESYKSGQLEYEMRSLYNERGDEVRCERYDCSELRDIVEREFDYERRECIEYTSQNNGISYTSFYALDEQGRIAEEYIAYEDGRTLEEQHTYLDYGKMCKYMRNNELVGNMYIAEYEVDGVVLETQFGQGVIGRPTIYNLYNNKGQLIVNTEQYYGECRTLLYEYNECDQLYLMTAILDGAFDYKELYSYDDRGNLTQLQRFDIDGQLTYSNTLVYDDMGNVIEDHEYPDSLDRDKVVVFEIKYRE